MNLKSRSANPHRYFLLASVVASVMCAWIGSVNAAQLYQWKDEKGVIQYTDKPPVGKAATKLKVKGPATLGDVAAEGAEKTGDAATQAAQDTDNKQCDEARKRLQVLESSKAVSIRNDDGTTRELNKEDMKMETEVSKLAVSRYCKPGAAK